MPARDTMHDVVKNALVKDGWTITHDPYTLSFGTTKVFTDLGAEKTIAAQRNEEKIAVEVKSFVSQSDVRELETALGQYMLYRFLMRSTEPERVLYLAVPESIHKSLFEMPAAQRLAAEEQIRLLVVDVVQEEVLQWLP